MSSSAIRYYFFYFAFYGISLAVLCVFNVLVLSLLGDNGKARCCHNVYMCNVDIDIMAQNIFPIIKIHHRKKNLYTTINGMERMPLY